MCNPNTVSITYDLSGTALLENTYGAPVAVEIRDGEMGESLATYVWRPANLAADPHDGFWVDPLDASETIGPDLIAERFGASVLQMLGERLGERAIVA